MGELFRLNWEAFDPATGLKAATAALLIFGLMHVTGESWIATGVVLLFAWLANVPGTLKDRLGGLLVFAIGAIVLTYLSGWLGLSLSPNVQLLFNPAANPDDDVVTVVGLRLRLTL